jgi:hypothetical protein
MTGLVTKAITTLLLVSLAGSRAYAGDAVDVELHVLDEGAQLERTHRIENAIAAGVTGSLLAYESVWMFRAAIETQPSGGLVDLSDLGKGVGYTLGTLTGLGAVTMLVLGVHDIASSPVSDARDAYVSGDHTSTSDRLENRELDSHWRAMRLVTWLEFGAGSVLAGVGAVELATDNDAKAGKATLLVGGTCALFAGTLLLHLREPVAARTYRRLSLGFTPTGLVAGGTF